MMLKTERSESHKSLGGFQNLSHFAGGTEFLSPFLEIIKLVFLLHHSSIKYILSEGLSSTCEIYLPDIPSFGTIAGR